MGKRGIKPQNKVKIKWSPEFAYVIGLLATDGCLSKDGRHIDLTSKDREQLENFSKCLKINNKIGFKNSSDKKCLRVQLGDVNFYKFLLSIGLMPKKTKIINKVQIPNKYFFDFLRGHFDGDGTFYSYWDKRWRSSHMFYLDFISASQKHINWLRRELKNRIKVNGHITKDGKKSVVQLKYAKKEAVEIIRRMYYNRNVVCLSRKFLKIEKVLKIEKQQQKKYNLNNARVEKLVNSPS